MSVRDAFRTRGLAPYWKAQTETDMSLDQPAETGAATGATAPQEPERAVPPQPPDLDEPGHRDPVGNIQPPSDVSSEPTQRPSHLDPITGAPGAHPLGTGLGAAAGGIAAGTLAGVIAGPIGAMVGAVVGAFAGGLAGKGVAEFVDPTAEEAYWREAHAQRGYVEPGRSWDDYAPAYRYGVDAYGLGLAGRFDDHETRLAEGWEDARGASSLSWEHARPAARDAWERVREAEQQRK